MQFLVNICSFDGGRPSYMRKSANIYDVGLEVARKPAINTTELRYYYDDHQGRCFPFVFAGDFGNYNNFISASDCELFCANRKFNPFDLDITFFVLVKCPHGSPLRANGAKNQRCTSNIDCPSTHQCVDEHKVCCPRPGIFSIFRYLLIETNTRKHMSPIVTSRQLRSEHTSLLVQCRGEKL